MRSFFRISLRLCAFGTNIRQCPRNKIGIKRWLFSENRSLSTKHNLHVSFLDITLVHLVCFTPIVVHKSVQTAVEFSQFINLSMRANF